MNTTENLQPAANIRLNDADVAGPEKHRNWWWLIILVILASAAVAYYVNRKNKEAKT